MSPLMKAATKSQALVLCIMLAAAVPAQERADYSPGRRVLLDAHNAYPYQGRWNDRIDRALATGVPLAIEQDLVWRPAIATTPAHSIVSHGEPWTGDEPTLRDFFERIRPIVTRALTSASREQWPLITLNLDFKDSHPQHFAEIWTLLREYEAWLTTAPRTADATAVQQLSLGPVLVLTGADPAQQAAFYDEVPIGSRLRLFGAVQPAAAADSAIAGKPGALAATNYRRWSNNPWSVVEPEGQNNAADWTPEDADRLRLRVRTAHDAGLWIRFYTLNGHSTDHGERMGWTPGYNFKSLDAARVRWRAAIAAGVDFIATDQYEDYEQISSR
jgi:hypothetical protein